MADRLVVKWSVEALTQVPMGALCEVTCRGSPTEFFLVCNSTNRWYSCNLFSTSSEPSLADVLVLARESLAPLQEGLARHGRRLQCLGVRFWGEEGCNLHWGDDLERFFAGGELPREIDLQNRRVADLVFLVDALDPNSPPPR
jgi:hypothetical protein